MFKPSTLVGGDGGGVSKCRQDGRRHAGDKNKPGWLLLSKDCCLPDSPLEVKEPEISDTHIRTTHLWTPLLWKLQGTSKPPFSLLQIDMIIPPLGEKEKAKWLCIGQLASASHHIGNVLLAGISHGQKRLGGKRQGPQYGMTSYWSILSWLECKWTHI